MSTIKTITVPIYGMPIKVTITNEIDAENCEAYVEYTDRGISLKIKPDATIGVVVHESVHIVNFIFKYRFIVPDLENDEPQAYLMEWVVEAIMKLIEKAKL